MRNKQLQDKLEEMLEVMRTQPDDMVVAHYTGLGLIELCSIGLYLADPDGVEAEGDAKVDCIILNI